MKSEMDATNMDERQRLCWLKANRLTLIAVGLVWLGMITWEVAHERLPWFLIVMVLVFAVIRVTAYWIYSRADLQ